MSVAPLRSELSHRGVAQSPAWPVGLSEKSVAVALAHALHAGDGVALPVQDQVATLVNILGTQEVTGSFSDVLLCPKPRVREAEVQLLRWRVDGPVNLAVLSLRWPACASATVRTAPKPRGHRGVPSIDAALGSLGRVVPSTSWRSRTRHARDVSYQRP